MYTPDNTLLLLSTLLLLLLTQTIISDFAGFVISVAALEKVGSHIPIPC